MGLSESNNKTEWPYRSLLLLGYFGPDSPGGKTLKIYSLFALILFASGIIGIAFFSSGILLYISTLCIPISVLILVWSNAEYLKELDTLSQLIQLKAFAFSYGTALFIGFSIYAINTSTGYTISPFWLLLAEPLRGFCLYIIAKEY